MTDLQDRILNAILPHVPFDGWSDAAFSSAASDIGVDMATARSAYPRGVLGVAIAYHKRGDQRMLERIEDENLDSLRIRDRIATAIKFRIEAVENKEVARRSATFFSLPTHGPVGARLIWETSDAIWVAMGDSSDDINWYTKRSILSAVYSSTILYWFGDNSLNHSDTWGFLDRRIENVMQFEKLKAHFNNSPLLSRLMQSSNWMFRYIKAPRGFGSSDLPGRWTD